MPTILIIEDEIDMAELIKNRLEEKGYNTYVAYTGTDGLEKVEELHPNVVTLDLYLPDTNGLKILQQLKSKQENKGNKIPVIVVSSADLERECRETGAVGYVKKPINFNKLTSLIEEVLSQEKNVE